MLVSGFSTAVVNTNTDTQSQQIPDQNKSSVPFLLADIGEGIAEVELLQWYVNAGDRVEQFDKICEVQSDKATVEITSRYDGLVASLEGNVGDMIRVGEALLYLHPTGSDMSPSVASKGPKTTCPATLSPLDSLSEGSSISHNSENHLRSDDDKGSTVRGDSKFQASPAVRRLGHEHNLDLSGIRGTGPRGRLLKTDVLTYLREVGVQQQDQETGEWKAPRQTTTDASLIERTASAAVGQTVAGQEASLKNRQQGLVDNDTAGEVVALKGYHRLMAQTMTASLQIPHMGLGDEIVVDQLLACRRQINAARQGPDEVQISLLAFFLKACSLALGEYPMLNSRIEGDTDAFLQNFQVRLLPRHDLGVAMATPRGLVVPVVRGCEQRSLLELQIELNRLKAAATESRLHADDLTTPTFTLSNIGSMNVGQTLKPVLVPPLVAMGALGRIQRVPRFVEDDDDGANPSDKNTVVTTNILHVSWAGDHRILDGATLARFHLAFASYVSNPHRMLLHLH
jgi:2-oxoisovalerate dehydrogenase E2 component (dihydrolipoyl transacylase)